MSLAFFGRCGAGSLLSEDQIKSVYAAFISLAMIGIYVRFGFQIVNDVGIGRIDEDFSLQGLRVGKRSFQSDRFRFRKKGGDRRAM